ncbi:hypothetical protein [Kribbella monticola]|uniref:hypothetical protein n=1 Tax=Kribbella monticola TaxID=2185285 RepID=UPI000DD2C537|nr:hypothetical protein [Kribbella monticola]
MNNHSSRGLAVAGLTGGLATVLSGVVIEAVVKPASDVSNEMWSYPWSSDALTPVSIVFAGMHLLVLLGMFAFARSLRRGRAGARLALVGTFLLFLAEFASIPFADQRMDETGPQVVGGLFGLGVAVTAIGLLVAGVAVLRSGEWHGWQRYAPVGAGVWSLFMIGLSFTSALPVGVAIYGLTLCALYLAVYTLHASPAGERSERLRARIEQ